METVCRYTSEISQFNSLDRRDSPRQAVDATIYTAWDGKLMRPCPVIECTEHGARVVLQGPVRKNDSIRVIIQQRNGQRQRAYARVAWTSTLTGNACVAGLDFQRQDFCLAG